MKDFAEFENKIGITFNDKSLLKQAFIHRSYINENPKVGLSHNERLEFLGDAVLELVTTDYLYRKYPEKAEGELTSFRAALVNTHSISEIASKLGANDYLLLSKGESKDTGKARGYILADTFESIVGAIYLDQGYDTAKKFIKSYLIPTLNDIVEKRLWRDSKSHFQEMAQEYNGVTPSYKVLKEHGPDHDKEFTIGVYVKDELVAEGMGKSKQDAEQNAAKKALDKKGWDE